MAHTRWSGEGGIEGEKKWRGGETDRFFGASGLQLAQPTSGQFHFRRAVFSAQLKSKIGNILAKAAALRRESY
jgi:hypothetical protein